MRRRTDYIVVHHSGADPAQTRESIHEHHRRLGWAGYGYHYHIGLSGVVEGPEEGEAAEIDAVLGLGGDNSDDSRRMVGMVPFENLVGPAQFVAVSFDNTTSIVRPWTLFTGFRGERFLKSVN